MNERAAAANIAEGRSTVRSRDLGRRLRVAVEHAGWNGKRVARALGWSESRVSRVLAGKQRVSEVDTSALLALCGVTGVERDFLLRLAAEQNSIGWRHTECLSTLAEIQTQAVRINEFHALLVPSLLQTERYARSVVSRAVNGPVGQGDSLISARLEGQRLFQFDDPAECVFFVPESALHLPVGGPDVMIEQLHYLLQISVRSRVSIRAIPTAVGAHAGSAGSCSLLEFAECPPVVYLDGETSGHFLEEPAEVRAYERVFGALLTTSLGEEQSRDLIRGLAYPQDHRSVPAADTSVAWSL
ncbi:MAG TPA: helix-turn-helix transcriptional regulator [Pseudonocardiaceae bacterium]|nr:helix-turn-helix transcriptional regulator [Pseudonocardiaceae bacterium]